jgi:hypothetical protein
LIVISLIVGNVLQFTQRHTFRACLYGRYKNLSIGLRKAEQGSMADDEKEKWLKETGLLIP